jgi:hypothetical protein
MGSPSPDAVRDLSTRELVASIAEFAGHLNAARRRWLGAS